MGELVRVLDECDDFGVLIIPVSCWRCGARLELLDDGRNPTKGSPGKAWQRVITLGCVADEAHCWKLHVEASPARHVA